MPKINVINWGLKNYSKAHCEQKRLRELRSENKIIDTLILTQHPPVMTIGRSGSEENIKVSRAYLTNKDIDIVEVERGGDITYHGPGQLIAYPIFHLPSEVRDVKRFIRAIEQVVVKTCREFGAPAVTIEGLTGVWISNQEIEPTHFKEWNGEKKISSIGLAFKRWTSYHGVSFNINLDLTPFSYIHLCGLKGKQATSLSKVLGKEVNFEKVESVFIKYMNEMWEEFNHG
ncbi:MAG: octanoyltransferase [Chlamydiae bacterium]|nr:MAG: octanoyltransferase [Chlamydiota bacterium]